MNVMDRLVLDNSITICWCYSDEKNDYADRIATNFPSLEAWVPSLWSLEIANAFLMGERRRRSTHFDTSKWLAFLGFLPINIDDEMNARAWSETINLARAQNLSSYDAAYLELAMRKGLPIATLDGKIKTAAAVVGVPLYEPTG